MLKSFAFKTNGVCSHTGELYGFFMYDISPLSGFPGGLVVKNLPANVGDVGSIPGSGRSPGEGNTCSSIFAWEIPWTEEPGGLQSMGYNLVTKQHMIIVYILLKISPSISCFLILLKC